MSTRIPDRRIRDHGNILSRMATAATRWTGSTSAFVTAFSVIVVWGITGPLFHYSDNWQLVINTSTTIVTPDRLALRGRGGDAARHQAGPPSQREIADR